MEVSRLMRDGTAEPVSRDQILRHEYGQGIIHFPCSADHEQDWQLYPVDPCSYYNICDHKTDRYSCSWYVCMFSTYGHHLLIAELYGSTA